MVKKLDENYWVYILLCENNSYYTGYTNNLQKRYHEHKNGRSGCKYTRSFKPIAIAQCWQVKNSKSQAMQLENKIKKLSRLQKEQLIAMPASLAYEGEVEIVDKEKIKQWSQSSKTRL